MITAICPGSCGELIQGMVDGREMLISYPIDCYSHVTVYEGKRNKNINSKSYRMLEKVFEFLGYDYKDSLNIALHIESDIPVSKGMSSSTADLVATAKATAEYLSSNITEDDIARLCVEIEPTDSILFSEITLFDHLKGTYKKSYGSIPNFNILLFEGRDKIDTIEFRKTDRRSILKNNEDQISKAIQVFEKGIKNNNLKLIGEAATISAFANQDILYKEGLDKIYDLAMKKGALGINVAHSGTVIGVMYDKYKFQKQAFLYEIMRTDFISYYKNINEHVVVPGGAKLQYKKGCRICNI